MVRVKRIKVLVFLKRNEQKSGDALFYHWIEYAHIWSYCHITITIEIYRNSSNRFSRRAVHTLHCQQQNHTAMGEGNRKSWPNLALWFYCNFFLHCVDSDHISCLIFFPPRQDLRLWVDWKYTKCLCLSKCLYQELCIGPTSNSSHILLHQSKLSRKKSEFYTRRIFNSWGFFYICRLSLWSVRWSFKNSKHFKC